VSTLTLPRGATRRVGLALGSGSARGLAHIGVLRAIKSAGFQVDAVAGTSMGALIGASFAAGGLDGLATTFARFDWKRIVSLIDPVFPRSGLIDGQKIVDFVRNYAPSGLIEHLQTPFRAVATDIASGDEVAIGTGDLIEAVRASIAVPGLFTPVRRNGQILVDGGLVNPVPVSVVREMGAAFVIAVDLNHDLVASRMGPLTALTPSAGPAGVMKRLLESLRSTETPVLAQFSSWLDREPLPGIFDVLLSSIYIMQARITQNSLRQDRPDIVIQPPLGSVRFMDFDRAEEIIEIGYRSAVQELAPFQ
jgi:NTE family protein